jgi:cob(I)alamin adenosyltransferase
MKNRLTKIYTKNGDKGRTSLSGKERLYKTDKIIECIGAIDELNCAIGLILINDNLSEKIKETLDKIQHQLFDIGGELSQPDYKAISSNDISQLENELDNYNNKLPHLKEFILPRGTSSATYCHLARSICRRTERRVWDLFENSNDKISEDIPKYLNRLSDLLFVLARAIIKDEGNIETFWNPKLKK